MSAIENIDTDLTEFLAADRASRTARSHATYFQALAENVQPDSNLGAYAEQAATELRRGYVAIAYKLLSIADDAAGRAESYRALMAERVA